MWRTIALFALILPLQARAAELSIYTGGSMNAPLQAAGAAFTARTGHTLRFTAGTTGVMLGKIRGGDRPDVVAISAEAVEALEREGRIVPGSRRDLARAVLGVGIKAGSPLPDISTVEAFKQAMLKARSIGYPDPALGATSGVYLAALFERLGIGPQMKAKTVVKPIGAQVAEAAATGEVELAVTFISEMVPDRRIAVVGTLPAEILGPTLYAAGVSTTAAQPEAAGAFVAFVTGPQAAAALRAAGVDPAQPR